MPCIIDPTDINKVSTDMMLLSDLKTSTPCSASQSVDTFSLNGQMSSSCGITDDLSELFSDDDKIF